MDEIRLTFLGSGDAFGSGGRLQPCLQVEGPDGSFLIDCGATVMPAIRQYGVNPNSVNLILLSHLHGDHFGGIPFFILDAQLVSKRTSPLVIAGPAGTAFVVRTLMETMFPGSTSVEQKFPVEIVELSPGRPLVLCHTEITAYRVRHMTAYDALALRVKCGDQIIAYTGDTEWTETLLDACRGADLVIAESYLYDKKVKFHLDCQTLLARWPEMQAKRLVFTHMGSDMLSRAETLDEEFAHDGRIIVLPS